MSEATTPDDETEPKTNYEVARRTLWNLDVNQADQGTINDAHDLVDYSIEDDTVTIDGYQDEAETGSDLAKTLDVLRYIHHDAPGLTMADKSLAWKATEIITEQREKQAGSVATELIAEHQEAAAESDIEEVTEDLIESLDHFYVGGENVKAFGIATEMARQQLDKSPGDTVTQFKYMGGVNVADVLREQELATEMSNSELGSYLVAALVNERVRPEKAAGFGVALEVARRWAGFSTDVEQKYRWAGTRWGTGEEANDEDEEGESR